MSKFSINSLNKVYSSLTQNHFWVIKIHKNVPQDTQSFKFSKASDQDVVAFIVSTLKKQAKYKQE